MPGWDQFLAASWGSVSWPAVVFSVVATWLVKRNAFKDDVAVVVGWRFLLKRNLPVVPVLLSVLFVAAARWSGLSWEAKANQGIVSGAIAAWGYETIRRQIFGET